MYCKLRQAALDLRAPEHHEHVLISQPLTVGITYCAGDQSTGQLGTVTSTPCGMYSASQLQPYPLNHTRVQLYCWVRREFIKIHPCEGIALVLESINNDSLGHDSNEIAVIKGDKIL